MSFLKYHCQLTCYFSNASMPTRYSASCNYYIPYLLFPLIYYPWLYLVTAHVPLICLCCFIFTTPPACCTSLRKEIILSFCIFLQPIRWLPVSSAPPLCSFSSYCKYTLENTEPLVEETIVPQFGVRVQCTPIVFKNNNLKNKQTKEKRGKNKIKSTIEKISSSFPLPSRTWYSTTQWDVSFSGDRMLSQFLLFVSCFQRNKATALDRRCQHYSRLMFGHQTCSLFQVATI